MIEPKLFDVVEILYTMEDEGLSSGAQGTIVEKLSSQAFMVEFINEHGETLALPTVTRDQFIVVWQAATEQDVPVADQVAQIVRLLPRPADTEVLNFARLVTGRQVLTP
ncbi:MAG: DUF4926 domain-containing protein [Chloroflexota bacterium]|jgi:hypothetical protein